MTQDDWTDREHLLHDIGASIAESLQKWFSNLEPMDLHLISMECAQAATATIDSAELPAAREFVARLGPMQ